ncbi:MAG: transposase [Armatimonadetes bacterium]|nr:transposase [Armatimonadota bacterium]
MIAEAYVGKRSVSFTICVSKRRPLFSDPIVVGAFISLLEQVLADHHCSAPIYCFMPDHLHLIVMGRDAAASPKEAIDGFKQKAGTWLYLSSRAERLQKGYWDHILRDAEDWDRRLLYICANPVRAGIVDHWEDHPHMGSIGHNLQELVINASMRL